MQTFRILGILAFIFIGTTMQTIDKKDLLKLLKAPNPLNYNLGIHIKPGKKSDEHVTICCHGYGHNNQIADVIHSHNVLSDHLISFNFPDHDISDKNDPSKSHFGTIDEILPLLYVIKLCVVDANLTSLNLYGFSAGGGAIINALAILNQKTYDQQLRSIGVTAEHRKKIIDAIQNGSVILDCPLKSIEEIIETRGTNEEFITLAQRYASNNMRPIDALDMLNGLSLNLLVYFEVPDDILGNKLDAHFIERLQTVNQGKTTITKGFHGGHNMFHKMLWDAYSTRKK